MCESRSFREVLSEPLTGEHLLLLYEDPRFLLEVAKAYLLGALRNNQLPVVDHVDDSATVTKLVSSLGINPQLVEFINIRSAYQAACRGNYKPLRQTRELILQKALEDGKEGIRILGRMGGKLTEDGRKSEALGHENAVGKYELPITGLCPYDATRIEPTSDSTFLIDLIRSHMRVIFPGITINV